MSLQTLMTNYADYNLWVNQQFVNWLSAKSDELLYKEVPSSYSSIAKTLNHIWETEEYWYSVISETSAPEKKEKSNELVIAEIFKGLINTSTLLKELIHSFTEGELTKKVKIVSPWFECDLPKCDYLLQVINHGTYHRGQIVTIGRNIGITDATNTDYNFYNVVKEQK